MEKTKVIRPNSFKNSSERKEFEITYPAIYIFKTNVREYDDAQIISKTLLSHFPGSEISFDLGDCDKVLRIKHYGQFGAKATELLKMHGFDCEELLD